MLFFFSFKQIEHFGQANWLYFELQSNIMYSPSGLCVVLTVSLCGLFQGVSAVLGDACYLTTDCLSVTNSVCYGGKCLCKYGFKENDGSTACGAITGYKGCNQNEDCGLGECRSNMCYCNSMFASGERCELHMDPFVLIPPSSRGVVAARLSIGTVLLMSALAALVPRP